MKIALVIILSILFTTQFAYSYEDELRAPMPILLQKGAFIKIVNIRTISTAIADEGDEVSFIVPTDIWCADALIFPKETIFYGFVEKIYEPVQGTNAAIKLKVNTTAKIVTKNLKSLFFIKLRSLN